jgi:predicted cobalt transporter CbtA
MTLDALGDLNWLAVIVGAVIYFAIGAVWFTPILLGRQWQRAIGWDETRRPPEMNPITYVGPALAYLVAAIATGMLAAATGSDTLAKGIVLGLVIGIGYALTLTAVDAMFDRTSPNHGPGSRSLVPTTCWGW